MADILSELGFDYEEIMKVDSDYFGGIFNAFETGNIDDIDDIAKKEAEEFKESKWRTFFLSCGASLIFVTYIAIVCANFIFFSKLPINISNGEETIHTYFPIANESSFISKFFSRPVSDRDFGEYRYGTTENIETSSGAKLSRLSIPPVGPSYGPWYLRFPYNLIEFGEYDYENANFIVAYFYARLAWLGRSTAAFYIFSRKICQLIFSGVSRVGNFLKI